MAAKAIRYCAECGAEIFHGEKAVFVNLWGEEQDDGDEGEFIEGAGVCESCGRELCADCGGFTDGLCKGCQNVNNHDY
jgi:hypothetical protein